MSGCFEDKVKVDMSEYSAAVIPKVTAMRASSIEQIPDDEAARRAMWESDLKLLRDELAEMRLIKPKTAEVREVHGKLCELLSCAASLAEGLLQLPPNADAAAEQKLSGIQASGDHTARDINRLLRKIAAEHDSKEALDLLGKLDLHPDGAR